MSHRSIKSVKVPYKSTNFQIGVALDKQFEMTNTFSILRKVETKEAKLIFSSSPFASHAASPLELPEIVARTATIQSNLAFTFKIEWTT